jgi:hypothetical protein
VNYLDIKFSDSSNDYLFHVFSFVAVFRIFYLFQDVKLRKKGSHISFLTPSRF